LRRARLSHVVVVKGRRCGRGGENVAVELGGTAAADKVCEESDNEHETCETDDGEYTRDCCFIVEK